MAKKNVKNHSKIKHVILAILIALVFVFFIAYAIQSVYPAPKYEDYCQNRPLRVIETESQCTQEGGYWVIYDESGKVTPGGPQAYCDFSTYYTECQKEYDQVREPYERNVFFANILFGIIAVIFSFFLVVETVSNGFMAGGTIMIIYGTIRYWGDLSAILRTIFLGIALAILIWLGYKKLK